MAKVASHPTRIWLDQYALASYLTATNVKADQEAIPTTTFGDSGPRRVVGNFDHAGEHSGLFDAADNALEPILTAVFEPASDHYLAQAFGSAAENDVVYERVVRLTDKPIEAKGGAAVLLNFSEAGAGTLVRGRILRSATVTGTGNGTGRNLGTTTSGQLFVVTFRLLSVTGGAITMKVTESSDDGGSDAYADVTGLTSGSLNAAGVVRVTTTAATEAYKRLEVSAMTASSATILVTAGVAAGY